VAHTKQGETPVIAVGRLGDIGASNASDTAMTAMFSAAQQTIRLSLQDLGPPKGAGVSIGSWPEGTMRELTRALGRGVDVYIVLSDLGAKGSGGGSYSLGWSTEDVAREFSTYATAHRELLPAHTDIRSLLCAHLHV